MGLAIEYSNKRSAVNMRFTQMIEKLAMEKVALTALKAKELARSVGLIAHPDSQWKRGLRMMRQPNPKGIKNAPLMQSGKKLQGQYEKYREIRQAYQDIVK